MPFPNIPIDLSLFPTIEGVYLVGGTTRDLLLGKRPADYDIAVFQNPEIFAQKTAAASHGRLIRMGRPGKRSFRVVAGGTILDITGVNGPTIRHDLERRDVTINAMAIEISSGALLDWVEGRRDLAEKRIRRVSEKGFRDDPIRLLRAFRLAAALGFSIEGHTVSTISRDAPLIRLSAGERIRSELLQLFSCRHSAPHVEMMAKTGLLRAILPELPPMPAAGGADPGAAHFQTRLPQAYPHLEMLLNAPPPDDMRHDTNTDSSSSIPSNPAAWLKLATILIRLNRLPGRWTAGRPEDEVSPGSPEKIMTAEAETACRRLRLSTKESFFVTGIVRNHIHPFHLYNAFCEGRLSPKAATRFFMAVDTLVPHLLLWARAEALSGSGGRKSFQDFIRHILRTYHETYLPGKARPPLVSGRDLMDVFKLPPSRLYKRILTRLEEERLSGGLSDRASALQLAGKMIRKFKP